MKNLITIEKMCGLAATNGNPAVDNQVYLFLRNKDKCLIWENQLPKRVVFAPK